MRRGILDCCGNNARVGTKLCLMSQLKLEKVIEMNNEDDYKIVTVFRSQQPDQFHIPRPDPNWDYAEIYEQLIKASEEIKSLIIYVSGLEDASEESADELLNGISFLSLDLQKCGTELYRRFLSQSSKSVPLIATEGLDVFVGEGINWSEDKEEYSQQLLDTLEKTIADRWHPYLEAIEAKVIQNENDISSREEDRLRIRSLTKMSILQNKYINRIFDFLCEDDLNRSIVNNCYEAYEKEVEEVLAELNKSNNELPNSNAET